MSSAEHSDERLASTSTREDASVTEPTHTPEPEEWDAPLERRQEEEAARYPGHENPDEMRARVGLGDQEPEPRGAPLPPHPDRGRPAPLGDDEG